MKIKAIKASTPSIGVDTMEDLERVRSLISSSEFLVRSDKLKLLAVPSEN